MPPPTADDISRRIVRASRDERVIVSSAFVQAGGEAVRARLVSLGRYALKGVGRPQELHTLEPI